MKTRQIRSATQKPFGAFVLSGARNKPLRSSSDTLADTGHTPLPLMAITALANNPAQYRTRESISFVHTCEQVRTPSFSGLPGSDLIPTHQLEWIVFTRVNTLDADASQGRVHTCEHIENQSNPPNPMTEVGNSQRLFTRVNTLARNWISALGHASGLASNYKCGATGCPARQLTHQFWSRLFVARMNKTAEFNFVQSPELVTKDAFSLCEASFVSDSDATVFTRVNTLYAVAARMFVHTCEQVVLWACLRPGHFGLWSIYFGVVFTRVNTFSINFFKDFVHTCEQSNGAAMS